MSIGNRKRSWPLIRLCVNYIRLKHFIIMVIYTSFLRINRYIHVNIQSGPCLVHKKIWIFLL